MSPLIQCRQRCALFSAIALSLASLPLHALAGTVTGPGATHTVNQGDLPELWDVSDSGELIIGPGGPTLGVQVDNASVLGTDVVMTGTFGIRLANTSSATLTGGTITIASASGDAGVVASGSTMTADGMTVTSAGRGFSTVGAGSTLTVRNTGITTGGESFEVDDDALLVLDNVQASSDGTAGGASGYALSMDGGTAQVTVSTLAGTTGGVRMTGGTLQMEGSQVQSDRVALTLAGNPFGGTPGPVATLTDSTLTGATGATVDGAILNLVGSTARGTDAATGVGVSLVNGTLSATQNSLIEGTTAGITMSGTAGGNNSVVLDASQVTASAGPALAMLASGNADVSVRNGTQLTGGNGIAVQVGSSATLNLDVTGASIDGDLVGDTTANRAATLNVTLGSGAALRGAILNGTTVQLADARWELTANSNVQQLDVGSGAVLSLGDGTAFHTLQVAGNYTGSGGTLVFNTVLAGDDAGSDRLVIEGDSSGQTNVLVNNIGGAGALTSRGISLIEIGGASNGSFDLAGRAVGGQYEYFLFNDSGDGGWYLRSQLPVVPDPCEVDPTLPQCGDPDPGPGPDPDPEPVPVLRPEPGAYLANLQAAQGMFRLGYHERQDGQNSGRAWARVDGTRTGFGANVQQLDVRGNSQALSVGTELFGNARGSGVGVLLASGNASSTSTSTLTGYYARGKVKGNALGMYGTWRAATDGDAYTGLYVDGSMQRTQFRNEVDGLGLPTERYDSRAWQGAVEVGYAMPISRGPHSTLFVEPQLQVGYTRWDAVQHTERNGTVVRNEDANGTFGRVGVRVSGVTRWQGAAAEVQPFIAAHWLRSGGNPYVRMDDEQIDARIPQHRAEFSAGASVRFPGGFGAWAGLALQRGSGYHQRSAQLGLSYRW